MKPESAIQQQIRSYLTARGIKSVHVPNGAVLAGDAKKRAIQMNALKRDGLCVGFPDLLAFAPKGEIGFIEVKVEGNKLSPAQEDCHEWLICLGHKVSVCRSIADVEETLAAWGWGA